MDKFVGKRLDGRYEIREIIGVGGMAVVYKAYDCIEDRIVAVKILKEEFISNEEFISRFKNESKAIAVLNHPNIVKVFDVSFGDLIQYIVMEYVDGITLKEYISKQGSLRWKDGVYLTIQVLRALQHAHDKGIVHRDVKPQNIMLLSDGTIKVTDFGIARFARSEHKTMTDKAIGSVHYISPEQARGDATDEKADIYSVGVMLYEMFTGRLPFDADSAVSVAIMQLQQDPVLPRDVNETIPVGLEQITMHAMQKDVSKRYRSAAEMLRDLEEFRRSPDTVFEYTYFVDNEPTKFVDVVNDADFPANDTTNIDEDDEQEEKSPIIPILAGVAVAFIIAAVVLFIFGWKWWGKTTESVTVPRFIGKTYEELVENYSDFNIKPEWKENSTVPANVVVSQSYPEGRKIKKSQEITVIISAGPKLIDIPVLTNLDLTTAKLVLKDKGFVPKVEYKTDKDVANGFVITTNPASGTMPYGSEIDIYVSLGPEIVYVPYSSYSGYKLDVVKKKIEEAGLTVGEVTYEDSSKPKDIVLSQSPDPKASSTIPKGTAIDIVVSSGKVSYEYTLKIDDFPKNFKPKYQWMQFAFYIDGVKYGEGTPEFDANDENLSPWSIEIKSQKTNVNVNVDIIFKDATEENGTASYELQYTVDMKNKSAKLIKNNIRDEWLDENLSNTSSVTSSAEEE